MFQEVIYYDDLNSKYGIISYPGSGAKDLPLVIFLNAGLVNRQGPNRVYVKLCQALTNIGFTCFRFDLPGIGDNVNNGKYSAKAQMYHEELNTVLNYFRTTKKVNSFILFGICTGADLAFSYALEDKSIAGISIVNGLRMPHEPFDYNIDKRYYQKYLTDARRWLKFISFKKFTKIPFYALMVIVYVWRKMRSSPSQKNTLEEKVAQPANKEAKDNWIRLLNSDIEILQIVTEGSESFDGINHVSPAVRKFNSTKENYREYIIYDADHTFTSITSQQDLISKVIAWCRSCFIEKMEHTKITEDCSVLVK